MLQTLLH